MKTIRQNFLHRISAHLRYRVTLCLILVTSFSFSPQAVDGQHIETVPAGSYIIDMGVEIQTEDNALKPYGLVWELLHNHFVPVKWSIKNGKEKDGTDFMYNGVAYRGGPFIIYRESRTPEVNAVIAHWEDMGVVGITTEYDFDAPINRTLNYSMNWTLDLNNGQIAQGYLERAGIPESAYNWVTPENLTCCNDVFVIPHAHPEWESHGALYYWNDNLENGGCQGAVWTGCKSGSETENMQNPNDPYERMNFLMEDPIAPETAPAVWANQHRNSKPPYTHQHHDHPIMQFIGVTDGAQENGAEQIYMPTNAWRPSTLIGIYDPDQGDVPSKSPGPAAKLAFGPAFGDTTRGYVVYEAGHNLDKGNEMANIAAQRAFLNFSFMAVGDKAIKPLVVVPPTMYTNSSYQLSSSATGGSGKYIFEWSSSCGGTFLNQYSANTTFIAPNVIVDTECKIKLIVKDDCGTRIGFSIVNIVIQPGSAPPMGVDDYAATAACNPVEISILTNDTDPNLDTLSATLLGNTNTGNGVFSIDANNLVSYTPNSGFSGIDQINYEVCDNTDVADGGPLCDVSTIYVTVNANTAPQAQSDVTETGINHPVTIDVLANDTDPEGGVLSISISNTPENGDVQVINGSIEYLPHLGFQGLDTFYYEVCDNACFPLCDIDTVFVNVSCLLNSTSNTIYGTVYKDEDLSNGLSTGDTREDSVMVKLFQDNNPVGILGPEDICQKTQLSDQYGNYRFDLDLEYLVPGTLYKNRTVTDADEAREKQSGNVEIDKDLVISKTDDNKWNGIRFEGINIPAGSIINNARLRLVSQNSKSDHIARVKIYGQDDTDNAAPFVDNSTGTITGRPRTSSNVEWVMGPWTTDNMFESPNLKSILQEILDDQGGLSNGAVVLITEAVGDNVERKAYDFGADPLLAPELLIDFDTPGGGPFDYIIQLDENTLPPSASLIGDDFITTQFINAGVANCENDFGFQALTNPPPLAFDDFASTRMNEPIYIDVMVNDNDPQGQVININGINTPPTEGGMAVINLNGTPGDPSDDFVAYTPPSNFIGEELFVYELCDNGTPVKCDEATVFITIDPIPDYAKDDFDSTVVNREIVVTVAGNDFDSDLSNIQIDLNNGYLQPKHGSISIFTDEGIEYVPDPGFTGLDSFEYRACQIMPSGTCDMAMVYLFVQNRPPDAKNDIMISQTNVPINVDVLNNDTEPDGHDIVLVTGGTDGINMTSIKGGLLSIYQNGTPEYPADDYITYTPPVGFAGVDTFFYIIEDTGTPAMTDMARVLINVTALTDLELQKEVFPATANVSDEVVFTLTLTNNGPSTAHEILIADRLTDSYSYVNDNGGGAFDPVGGIWHVPQLGPGQTTVLSITAELMNVREPLNVTEVISSNEYDIDSTPNNDDGDQSEDDEASAQPSVEICYNNIDDDGDGLVDCYDPDCTYAGTARSVVIESGVDNAENALGSQDGQYAEFYDNSDQLIVEFPDIVSAGNVVAIRWRRSPATSSDPSIRVEKSRNGMTWSNVAGSPFALSNTNFSYHTTTLDSDARYLRFTSLNIYNADLDAMNYSFTCAVEVCDNGIDDDADGLIDCADPQCFNNLSVDANIVGDSICSGDFTILNATAFGGDDNYTFSWNNGGGTGASVNVDPLVTTNYTVMVTDGNGCTNTDQVEALVLPILNLDAGADQEMCLGSGTSITAIGSGGSGSGYTYTWSNGLGTGPTKTVNPTMTTTYTITVTDGNGCTGTDDVTITIYPLPTVTASGDQSICSGSSAAISASGSGGSGGDFTYEWSHGLGSGPDKVISPTSSTTYSVTITDGNGCMDVDQVLIDINSAPEVVTMGDTIICPGISTTISAAALSGDGSYTYAWSNGLGVGSSKTVSPISTTTYTAIVTDGNGCTDLDQVTINVNDIPVANAGSDRMICDGEGITLNGNGGESYQWAPGTGLNASNIPNPLASPSITTTYTLTITDTNGCTDTDNVLVTVNNPPSAGVNQSAVETCLGQGVLLNANGGTSYSWGPSTGLSDAMMANPVASPFITTSYVVTVMDDNGCTDTDQVVVTVNSNQGNADAGPNVTICQGESTALNASGGLFYNWSPSTGLSSTTRKDPIASPLETTTYSVTVTDSNGCTDVDAVTITVDDPPIANAGMDREICTGESTSLSASGGVGYIWGPSIGLDRTDVSNPIATPSNTTTYTVTITDGNGCTDTDQVSVTVNSKPIVTVAPHDSLLLCANTGGVQISATGGTTYNWSPAIGLSDANIANPIADPISSTTYVVTVTDANGCSATKSIFIELISNQGTASAGTDVEICRGEVIELSASGGVAYSWSPSTGLSYINIENPLSSATTTTLYTVTITDTNGCTAEDDVLVTVNIPPVANAGIDKDICFGESVTLNGSGGSSYRWTPGFGLLETTTPDPVANPNQVTTYTLEVTDDNGCKDTDQVLVSVYPQPIVEVAKDTFIICGNETVQFEAIGGVDYIWSPGSGLSATNVSNPVSNPSMSTLYTVTVTNVWGCSATGTVYVDKDGTGDADNDFVCIDIDNCPGVANADQIDTDGDGVGDACDLDDDNDGILDVVEDNTPAPLSDTDGDGVPDRLDLDSDNDGILDLIEAGVSLALDINRNGIIDQTRTFGSNGYSDDLETFLESGISSINVPNSDQRGQPDFQDLDSDDDGLCDLVESGADPGILDSDGDGVINGSDFDNDGITDLIDKDSTIYGSPGYSLPRSMDNTSYPDYIDADRDDPLDYTGDGIGDDVAEAGYLELDQNGDGRIDAEIDMDHDGIIDTIDALPGYFGGICGEPIRPDNMKPVAIADLYYSEFGHSIFISPSENDFDPDGVIDISSLRIKRNIPENEGNVLFNEQNGTIYYVPANGFQGQTSFTYTIEDDHREISNTTTVTIVVGNPGLLVTNQDFRFTSMNEPIDIEVLSNDFSLASKIDSSSIMLVGHSQNGVAECSNGIIQYVPGNGFNGTDHFYYTVADQSDNRSVPTLVEIYVFDTLNIVLALDDVYRLTDTITIDIVSNDRSYPDSIDVQSLEITEGPTFGEVQLNSNGTVKYTSRDWFEGTDYFKYTVKDVTGRISNIANVILIVRRDTDGDLVADILDIDDDNDGILDSIELELSGIFGDSDEDGVPDDKDLDSDNDGINDVIEAGRYDLNRDGLADGTVNEFGLVSSLTGSEGVLDTDGDEVPDYLDLDSDGDGVQDIVESGNILYLDVSVDGRIDDLDSDKDGIVDLADNLSNVWGEVEDFVPRDTDSDALYNFRDNDDDGDNVLTLDEDTNANLDWYDDDTDGDDIVDYLDPNLFVFLSAKVFLQGPYSEYLGWMNDDLRELGCIPLQEPYTELGYNFICGGGEQIDPALLEIEGGDAIVDWVILELRDSYDPSIIRKSRAALVQRDGDIVDTDGSEVLRFLDFNHGDYYLGVRHRNHLGVMTYAPRLFNHMNKTLDFTSIDNDERFWTHDGIIATDYPMKVLQNGVTVLWGGNVNFDNRVLFQGANVDPASIFIEIMNSFGNEDFLANYIKNGYSQADANMDGRATFQGFPNDTDLIFFNTIQHPDNMLFRANFIINEQMPDTTHE